MTSNDNTENEFVFRKNDDIGAAGAEDDASFLDECFVDTGDLEILYDCETPKRIIVGRTGAGKTALLSELEKSSKNVIIISPHSLSLNYIANNNVIRFFEDAGVNLLPFYGLLWKHIIVVELLKSKFEIKAEDSHRVCIARLKQLISKDNIKEQAVDYLEKWGNKFWLTTEERMQELTSKIENSLTSSLGINSHLAKASLGGAKSLSIEERKEVVERGKRAVSEVQIRELENLISVLDEVVFTDRKQHYYITIDTLDEEWADDRIRYRLIKSLIDAVRRFRKVSNVKIIVALRQDLLDKVLHSTHDPGFQEEKYESLYLYVRWTSRQLKNLVESRLNALIRHRYTSRQLAIEELFPNSIDGKKTIDYILSRTFLRPRDAILFVNDCIALAEGKPRFTATIIKKAEEEYSHKRLQSLAYEWQTIHPYIKEIAGLFYGMKEHFPVSEITNDFLCKRYEEIAPEITDPSVDRLTTILNRLYTTDANFESIRNTLIRTLHLTGLIGIKTGPTSSVNWAYESRLSLAPGQIRGNSSIHIHPMFYRALGVNN